MKNIALLTIAGLAMTNAKSCSALNVNTGAGTVQVCGTNFNDNGSTCTYTCTDGSSRSVQCLKGATWSTASPCPGVAPAPAPAPAPTPAPASCGNFLFNTGTTTVQVCASSPSGTVCNFACNSANVQTRSTTCTNGVWSAPTACPKSCASFSVDNGLALQTVCAGNTVDSATCSYSCASGQIQQILCLNGAFSTPATSCPVGTNCGGVNLFPTTTSLVNTVPAQVSQDLPDKGRFRVEWNADTAGLLAPGHLQILGGCAVAQAPTVAELAAVFTSGKVVFSYNRDTIVWDFGPVINPIYTGTVEPDVVLAENAAGNALVELIWDPLVPGAPIIRVQALELTAFPNGWPANTEITVNVELNLQLQGKTTIYTYTTSSGRFVYGTVGTGPMFTVAAGGLLALVGAGYYLRKRASSVAQAEEAVPELETISTAEEFENVVQ